MAPTLLRSAPCLPAALALISVLIAIALTPALMHVPSTRIGLARTHYRPILAAALTFRLSHSGIIMDATNEVTGSSPSYFFNAVAKVATATPGMLVATATETPTRLTLQNCQKPEDVRPYVTEHLSMTLGFTGGVSDGNRIDSIFPSRGAHRDCSSIDYWTGPEREKFSPQATCSFDEATAAEFGLALLESSDLEVEIVRQAVMGIEARSPRVQRGPGLKSVRGEFRQPSASEPSAAKQSALGTGGTNLGGELSGEGDGAADEEGPSRETATPAAKSAAAVTSPKFTPGGTARSLVTTNKERKEKVDLEALSRAAHQILQMHVT